MKKFLFASLMVLLVISFMPMPSQAINPEPISAEPVSKALKSGSLIKASTGSVYYYGANGKRFVFPNEKTYKTWFISFDLIITIKVNSVYYSRIYYRSKSFSIKTRIIIDIRK